MNVDELLKEYRPKINETIEFFKTELSSIRTGRASSGLIENLKVPYYGAHTPITQMANIAIPDPQTIVIQPWDRNSLSDIERAIINSELSLTPSNDGEKIFIKLPPLTEERRQEFVKIVHHKTEEIRIAIRNQRQNMMTKWDTAKDEIGEDDFERGQKTLQEVIDKANEAVEELAKTKEKELMTF